MANENDANFANQSRFANANDDFKSSEQPKRTDKERKETRRSYKMMMETTAKFDEVEPFEVS